MEHDFIRYDTHENPTPRMYGGNDFMKNATQRDMDILNTMTLTANDKMGRLFLSMYEKGKAEIDDPLCGYAYYPLRALYYYATACIPFSERDCVSRPHTRVYTTKGDSRFVTNTDVSTIDYFVKKYQPECIKCAWNVGDGVGWAIITNYHEYSTFMEERPFKDAECISIVFVKNGKAIPLMFDH